MAKKKAAPVVYYTPPIAVQEVKDIINEKIEQIPQYEDSGVKYQGKYKIFKSGNRYELKTQQTRYYVARQATVSDFTWDFSRTETQKKFYCTKLIAKFYAQSGFTADFIDKYITLMDTKGANSEVRFYYYPSSGDDTLVLDFTDSPRLFEGETISVYMSSGIPTWTSGNRSYILFELYGWEEEN